MKQLLMSIQPQHLYNILTGKKTLEIRKQIPKGFKGWVNLYCTMGKPYLIKRTYENTTQGWFNLLEKYEPFENILNGKVVVRFWFDEYDVIGVDSEQYNAITEKSCLTIDELIEYCNGKDLYAMHIKNLEIFDKPKELSEFYYFKGYTQQELLEYNHALLPITRVSKAPQNYMYVEVEE